ncbi:hypothetical protein U1Q18_031361 [Sarracenia purpurea var. burkii]
MPSDKITELETSRNPQEVFQLLFHLFERIDRTFSLCAVPPAYYAHLAAFRARFYMEPDMQENGSSMGHVGKTARTNGEFGVRPLPALKENVKRVMFYC